jgi:hypothetical protein
MKITNDESLNRLEVSVEGGLGILRYQIARDTMWLLHVQVPPEAQGQALLANSHGLRWRWRWSAA